MTVHDDIDNLLAADLHGDLSDSERTELQNHLLDCAVCRQAFQETKTMNQLLEEKLEKPDPAFEQRMLAGFHRRIPLRRGGLGNVIIDLLRLRSARFATVAAVLLALALLGRMITQGPGSVGSFAMRDVRNDELPLEQPSSDKDAKFDIASTNINPPSPPKPVPTTWAGYNDSLKEKAAGLFKSNPGAGGSGKMGAAQANAPAEPAASPQEVAAEPERTIVTGSTIPTAEETAPNPAETPNPALANQKLIRNATVALEIANFDLAVQKITEFAGQERGYVATSSSEKQENGKLRGQVVVKVLPENLDRFLGKVRTLGDLKNQTIGTEDVTKQYFDTESRLKNSRVMEQRLIEMLKTKTGKVSDLLQVEKELGRVREEIEKMQGELKYWDSQVQFATVTISLAEKDLEEPAAFLLKERAQLSLYTPDVEKIYNEIKAMASPKVQITDAQLDHDNSGRVAAHLNMLIVPEESGGVIDKVKSFGRVGNFQTQTERIAQGGNGLSESAKTKRDKVEVNVTIARETEEQAVQETSLRILTSEVDQKASRLKEQATKSGAEIRNSTFTRDPEGREVASISLRVGMKDYPALMKSFDQLGQVKDVSVQRRDRTDKNGSETTAPADVSIQIYSQGNIVSSDTGLIATIRHTIAQSVGAIMWSIRMIGVAVAFLAPWAAVVVVVIWIVKRIKRARSSKS